MVIPPEPITPEDSERRRESYTEISRRYRRSFFDQDQWLKHRRSDRFVDNLLTLSDSGVVRALKNEVFLIGAIASVICIWNALMVAGFDDWAGVHHNPIVGLVLPLVKLPAEPLTVSSPALGLLLVFRTNASYGRWNEARTAWGSIINNSRSVVRMGACWTQSNLRKEAAQTEGDYEAIQTDQKAKLTRLAGATWAFSRSLKRHLLSSQEDEMEYCRAIHNILDDSTFASSLEKNIRHRPTRALYEMTVAIKDLPDMPVLRQVEVEKSVTELCDALGACERIFGSPVPLVYTRHTARFLAAWLFLVPAALYQPFEGSWNHWAMIPCSVLISVFLLGIEELAVQLEEPFSILPMQKMTDGIGLSVNEHMDWHFEDDERFL